MTWLEASWKQRVGAAVMTGLGLLGSGVIAQAQQQSYQQPPAAMATQSGAPIDYSKLSKLQIDNAHGLVAKSLDKSKAQEWAKKSGLVSTILAGNLVLRKNGKGTQFNSEQWDKTVFTYLELMYEASVKVLGEKEAQAIRTQSENQAEAQFDKLKSIDDVGKYVANLNTVLIPATYQMLFETAVRQVLLSNKTAAPEANSSTPTQPSYSATPSYLGGPKQNSQISESAHTPYTQQRSTSPTASKSPIPENLRNWVSTTDGTPNGIRVYTPALTQLSISLGQAYAFSKAGVMNQKQSDVFQKYLKIFNQSMEIIDPSYKNMMDHRFNETAQRFDKLAMNARATLDRSRTDADYNSVTATVNFQMGHLFALEQKEQFDKHRFDEVPGYGPIVVDQGGSQQDVKTYHPTADERNTRDAAINQSFSDKNTLKKLNDYAQEVRANKITQEVVNNSGENGLGYWQDQIDNFTAEMTKIKDLSIQKQYKAVLDILQADIDLYKAYLNSPNYVKRTDTVERILDFKQKNRDFFPISSKTVEKYGKNGLDFLEKNYRKFVDDEGDVNVADGENQQKYERLIAQLKSDVSAYKSYLAKLDTASQSAKPTYKQDQSTAPSELWLKQLDGNWFSKQWKYGYQLQNGVGTATATNSPNFQIGQKIIQLTAKSATSFVGQQVYTDGKFYNIIVSLRADGRLYFEGEKNAKWYMER